MLTNIVLNKQTAPLVFIFLVITTGGARAMFSPENYGSSRTYLWDFKNYYYNNEAAYLPNFGIKECCQCMADDRYTYDDTTEKEFIEILNKKSSLWTVKSNFEKVLCAAIANNRSAIVTYLTQKRKLDVADLSNAKNLALGSNSQAAYQVLGKIKTSSEQTLFTNLWKNKGCFRDVKIDKK